MKLLKYFLTIWGIILIIVFTIIACEEDSKDKYEPMPDIAIVDISDDSDWDYWVVGKGDYFFIEESGGYPTAVSYHVADDNKNISIFFTNNGMPNKVVIDDYIYIFDNFDGDEVDIAAISPNGDIQIVRKVDSGINWDNYNARLGKVNAWSDVVNWTGRVLSGVPCALTAAAAVSTGGIFTPVTVFVCGSFILSLAGDIAEDEFDVNNGFTEFADLYGMSGTALSCHSGDLVGCGIGAASSALDTWADDLEEIENREDEVQVAEGALIAGSGQVQITLTWDTTDDIDLWVTGPDGERIYYGDKHSSSGGELDFDDTNGYGPENVYWPHNSAPNGTYKVEVDHYSGSYTTNYTVLVTAFGYTKAYYGYLSPNETKLVVQFQSNSPLPKIGLHRTIITENNKTK